MRAAHVSVAQVLTRAVAGDLARTATDRQGIRRARAPQHAAVLGARAARSRQAPNGSGSGLGGEPVVGRAAGGPGPVRGSEAGERARAVAQRAVDLAAKLGADAEVDGQRHQHHGEGDRQAGCGGDAGAERHGSLQHVPDPAHGMDQRPGAGGLELAPQVADVDAQGVRRRPEVVAPDAVVDQVERLRTWRGWAASAARAARTRFSSGPPGFRRRPPHVSNMVEPTARRRRRVGIALTGRPPQERPQARLELADVEGLTR